MKILAIALFSLVSPLTWAFATAAHTIPEPASLPLIGLGVVAMILARKRKK